MKTLVIAVLLVFSFVSPRLWAMEKCTKKMLSDAEDEALVFTQWEALYNSYSKFRACDNGGDTSEGYSESVVRLLVDHWDQLPKLADLSRKDRNFKNFVLRHIDATTSTDDLKKVLQLSKTQCVVARSLCVAIRSKAGSAINESNETP